MEKMIYKKGDRVKLKPYDERMRSHRVGVHNDMIEYFGEYVTINNLYHNDHFDIIEDNDMYAWSFDWIESFSLPKHLFKL